ncbi:unnamed protein product [Auanema sp. JU1783]|nr:unnamed protein product [Auanema sp. JU1783]
MIPCALGIQLILYFILFNIVNADKFNLNVLRLKNLDPEIQVIAFDVNHGSIALGCSDSIFIYEKLEQSFNNSKLVGTVALPQPISSDDGFLELKLIGPQQVLYCDRFQCRLCTVSFINASCSTLELTLNGETLNNMESAFLSSRSFDRIFLRIAHSSSDGNKAAIFSFDIQDTGLLKPDQIAPDADYIQNLHTVAAFSHDSFSFFITSSLQPNEPLIFANIPTGNYSMLKITRICESDKTRFLESRIDHSLHCSDPETFVKVEAAYHDKLGGRLYIAVLQKNKEHIICSYNMNELNREMTRTWDVCQNVTLFDVSRHCQMVRSADELQEHCYIFTRAAENYRSQSCVKFGLSDETYDNCKLNEVQSRSYRYAWLENFKPIKGTIVARINRGEIGSILADHIHNALFVGVRYNKEQDIIRILMDTNALKKASRSVWQQKTAYSARVPIISSNEGTQLFYLNRTSIAKSKLDCQSLYTSCSMLERGGFHDSLGCIWCPDPEKQSALSATNKLGCSQPLSNVCPPIIDHANRDSGALDWQVFGSNLLRLEKSDVLICGMKCTVNRTASTNSKLQCSLTSEQDYNCDVKVIGILGEHNQFIMKAPKITSSVIPERMDAQNKSLSKGDKAIIAISAVIVLIIVLALIIYFGRRLVQQREKRDQPLTFPLGTFDRTASRDMDSVSQNYYLDLYSVKVPSRYKIDINDIKVERLLGKGGFGTVMLAIHQEQRVAVKIMSSDATDHQKCSEFLEEGLILANFDHENVLKLIGIAFIDKPAIVMEYMEKKDLHTYLRQEDLQVTLKNLLNYAIGVANGMAHIHSKGYIHRDLAARNCILNSNDVVKISDFGMSREIEDGTYFIRNVSRKLPIKWMPPEAMMNNNKADTKLDVWAYGVVVWEIMTRGGDPYDGIDGGDLKDNILQGYRLEKPEYCPDQIYNEVMMMCWKLDPTERPPFDELVAILNKILIEMGARQKSALEFHYQRVR